MIVGRLLRDVVVVSFPAASFMRISQEIPPSHVMLPEDAGNAAIALNGNLRKTHTLALARRF
jgi:hypothetical protein